MAGEAAEVEASEVCSQRSNEQAPKRLSLEGGTHVEHRFNKKLLSRKTVKKELMGSQIWSVVVTWAMMASMASMVASMAPMVSMAWVDLMAPELKCERRESALVWCALAAPHSPYQALCFAFCSDALLIQCYQ